MSTYCTVRDVRAALTPGADASPEQKDTAAGLADWQIEDAILEAEGTLLAYIATRYVITTDEVEEEDPDNPGDFWVSTVAPSPIRGWTRNIAAFLAALTFRKNKDLGEDDPIRLRYRHTMTMLEAVRDRKMDLPLGGASADDQGVHVENLYEGHLFDMVDVGLAQEGYSPQVYIPAKRWLG